MSEKKVCLPKLKNSVPVVPDGEGNTNSSPSSNPPKVSISPAKNWCFTYNNYTDVPMFQNLLLSLCSKFVFQEETGENGTEHLQGYCEFKKKERPKSVIKIDKIHWEITRDVKASIAYCSKVDTRTGKIYKSNIIIPKPLKIINELRSWQEDIVNIIDSDPDDRKIYWFWENTGGVGKTVFCKYLVHLHGALVLSGKAADMKYGIIKFIEKHFCYPEIIVFDIPRSNLEFLSYTGLEEVKNGLFFSSKYESDMVIGNSPHVICFANEKPELDKVSKDRWIVREIPALK